MMIEKAAQTTPLNDSKLLGITLFHSFISGKLFEVKALGHTNNTGDNGAGKSTLLSLLPAFYGAEPSKLVDREADKASFLDYYLPTAKSLIVFEYQKEGQKKCSILYRNNASLAYRFVECAVKDLFSQPLHDALVQSGVDAKSWLRNIVSEKYPVSAQIESCADYRAVILNNKRHLSQKRRLNNKLISIASTYSLCSAEYEMNHIDVLTATMMRHKKMLSRFKKMIVDCFLTDTALDAAPYHKENMELIESLDVFVQLQSKQYQFDETLANKHELDGLTRALSLFERAIKEKTVFQEGLLTQYKNEHEQDKEARERFKEECKAHENTLSDEAYEITREFTRKTKSIDDLYERREQYDNNENITGKIAEHDQLSVYFQAQKDSHEHYTRLIEGIKEEEKELESRLYKLSADKATFDAKKQTEIGQIKDIKLQIMDEENERLKDIAQAYQKECEAFEDENKKKTNELDEKLLSLSKSEGEAQHYTQDQKAQLTALDEENKSKQNEYTDLQQKIIDLGKQKEACIKSRDERLKVFHLRKAEGDALQRDIAELHRFIEPQAGTLCAFLEKNVPDWRDSFGKVISPHLLDEKQLAPVLETMSGKSVLESMFGVSLNLEAIETPDFALSHEQLLEKRDRLFIEISEIEKRTETAKNSVKLDESDLKDCIQEMLINVSLAQSLKKELEQLRLMDENCRSAFDIDMDHRLEDIQVRMNTLQIMKRDIQDALFQTLKTKKEDVNEQSLQAKADFQFKQSNEDEKINNIQTLIKEKSDNIKIRIQDHKAAYTQAMQAKGVDEKSIEKARSQRDADSKKHKTVEGYAPVIRAFLQWEKLEWINIEEYKRQQHTLKIDKERLERAIREYKDSATQKMTALDVLISQKSEQIQILALELKSLFAAVSNIVKEMGERVLNDGIQWDKTDKDVKEKDAALVIHSGAFALAFVNEKITDINKLRQNIVRNVKDVSNTLLSLDDKNEIKRIWVHLRQARLSQMREMYDYDVSVDNSDFSIACLKDLEKLLVDVIPDIRDVRLESIRSVSTQISNFHETLKQINSKIDKVSNTLVKSIETANPFPAIDRIQIKLSSKIHTYEIWKELNAFSLEFAKWIETGKEALPSKGFVTAFRQLNESLKTVKISKDLESLVEMEITVVENGRSAVIKQDEDLEKVGSEGISKLAIIVVFCGMTRFLCQDKKVTIHWPLDELGKISVSNLTILFNMMTNQSISLFTAQPDPHHGTLKFFTTKNHVVKGVGVKSYISERSGKHNPLLNSLRVQKEDILDLEKEGAGHE